MNVRHYFITHAWFGKLIGAALGFLVAGPGGALLGIFIGNLFDRGLSEHFTKPQAHYHAEKRAKVKQVFQHATFSIMGHIAKADGRVSEKEIAFAKTIMQELRLTHRERLDAQQAFSEGKSKAFQPKEALNALKSLTHDSPRLQISLIQLVYRMALVDGLSVPKVTVLNVLLNAVGLAPLHEQSHARQNYYQEYHQKHRGNPYNTPHPIFEEDAYRVLSVDSSASKQEVKRAYRKLISKYHPDRQIAEGASEAAIKTANEKTQTIRKAYEAICKERGW